MDPKIIAELAALGVYIIPLDEPAALHKLLAEALNEEYLLDRKTHGSNKEWTND